MTLYGERDHSVRREKTEGRKWKTTFPNRLSCEGIREEVAREDEGNPGDCDNVPGREGRASFKEDRVVKQEAT